MTAATAVKSAGLADFQRRRRQDSRESLLAAATEAFCAAGYFAVSVEDIASAAGVSRMTFYRHFSGKAALASELFRLTARDSMPLLVSIGERDFRNHTAVEQWISDLFAAGRASRQLLQVFIQANVEGDEFAETGHSFIADIITGLGQRISGFAIDPANRRRWLEAWLLIYEILDQSNHAARESGVATDPLVSGILADRFHAFVTRES